MRFGNYVLAIFVCPFWKCISQPLGWSSIWTAYLVSLYEETVSGVFFSIPATVTSLCQVSARACSPFLRTQLGWCLQMYKTCKNEALLSSFSKIMALLSWFCLLLPEDSFALLLVEWLFSQKWNYCYLLHFFIYWDKGAWVTLQHDQEPAHWRSVFHPFQHT